MQSNEADDYWQPICDAVTRLRCWARLAPVEEVAEVSPWGQLLIIPTAQYLEACYGPVPIRKVKWVQVVPINLRGGLAGRPLEFLDIQSQAVEAIRETRAEWTFRDELWSLPGLFEARPVVAIHIHNPFEAAA